MQKTASGLAYLAASLGAIAFLAGVIWNNDAVIGPSGAVVVAALALAGATAGFTTWQDERERAREKEQRDTYSELVRSTLRGFSYLSYDPAEQATLRAQVVTWADAKVVKKLAVWRGVYDRHVGSAPSGTRVALTPIAKAEFEVATAELALAIRHEIAPGDQVTVQELKAALFNNPSTPTPLSAPPTPPSPPEFPPPLSR